MGDERAEVRLDQAANAEVNWVTAVLKLRVQGMTYGCQSQAASQPGSRSIPQKRRERAAHASTRSGRSQSLAARANCQAAQACRRRSAVWVAAASPPPSAPSNSADDRGWQLPLDRPSVKSFGRQRRQI
ncbi:MAG: hypothetical protein U0559_01755 [Anaerolineae bacterium]